jgi:hypothetical protein
MFVRHLHGALCYHETGTWAGRVIDDSPGRVAKLADAPDLGSGAEKA